MANILIVDDSRTSRKILKGILEEAGYTVIGEAENGEQGYLQYKALKPDIVTMDITMPVMDGLEALQLIKRTDSDATVIMLTAAGQKEKVEAAIRHGAADFLMKPYEKEKILEMIEKNLK